MRADSLYRLSAACLVTHELDSILLQGRSSLNSIVGYDQQIFMWAHVPIVLAMLSYAEFSRRASVRYGMCVFAVVHVGIHWFYRDQPVYDFASMTSWVLILLAGIFGAAYMVPAKAR
jgi:TctA family transporter